MTDLQLNFYCGTGVFHLPILGAAANRYYSSVAAASEVITLPLGGLVHPQARHSKAGEVARRMLAKSGATRRLVSGHSQGAEEALEDAIDNPDVEAAILVCGPLDGSDKASRHIPIPGVRGMSRGSRHLDGIRSRTDRMLAEREHPPYLYLIAAHHDGLVGCESAFAVSPNYPEHLVRRYCVSHGDPGHANAQWVKAPWGFDNHLSVIWAPGLISLVRSIINLHSQPETALSAPTLALVPAVA